MIRTFIYRKEENTMKKMKKLACILLVGAMTASLLGGCTGNTTSSTAGGTESTGTESAAAESKTESAAEETKEKEPSNLLLWMPPYATDGEALDQQWWTETLAPWAEENNVTLSIEITPWSNYAEKYLTAFSSGQGPDVGYMYNEMFNDFIDMGTLEELSPYFTEEDTADYIYYDLGYIKGGQYALPFIVGNARVLFFNMDILEQAGVTELPETWEDLTEVCVKVKDANIEGVIPFAQEWADTAIGALNSIYYPYLWQAGGDIFDENGEVALMQNDGAVKAAQYVYDMRYTYGVLPDESMAMTGNDVRDQFAAGKVAVAMGATNQAALYTENGLNWDYVASLKGEQQATWIASDALIMNAAGNNKEMAAELMKHITSPAIMEKFHSELSAFPPINKSEKYLDNERFASIYENEETLHTLPVAPNSYKVMDSLYKNLQLMMLGDLTPEQAIQQTVDYAGNVS